MLCFSIITIEMSDNLIQFMLIDCSSKNDCHQTTNNLLNNINYLLEEFAFDRKFRKKEFKLKAKHW